METDQRTPPSQPITSAVHVVLTWRPIAGAATLEAQHTWVAIPRQILEWLGRFIDDQFSVQPNGPPSEADCAIVTLDVFGEVPGRLVVVDEGGSEHPFEIDGGVAVARVPTKHFSGDDGDVSEARRGSLALRWYPPGAARR